MTQNRSNLYARTVGKLEPTTAEWIVLINSEDYEW